MATFEVLISLSLNDDSVTDAKEFHKLQTLYLQVMADIRNVDRKIKVQTEVKFSKNYSGQNKEPKATSRNKIVGFSFCMLFDCLYHKDDEE